MADRQRQRRRLGGDGQDANSAYDRAGDLARRHARDGARGRAARRCRRRDLNENQQSTQQLAYTGKPYVSSQHSETETLVNKGGGSAGTTTGTVSTGSTGNANYTHKITDTQNVLGKTITTTTVAPGTIKSQSVSVLVPTGLPASEVASLLAAVESAIGYVHGRDTVTVKSVPFVATPKVKTTTTAAAGSGMLGMAKDALVGIGALVFLIGIWRVLRRREREGIVEPTWLREFERPRSLIELEEETGGEPVRVKRLRTAVNPAKVQVEDLVSREPDRIAAQVREWMADD